MSTKPASELFVSETTYEQFTTRLSRWASRYVDEIAVPVMKAAPELYKDPALLKVVDLWAECEGKYRHSRHTWLTQLGSKCDSGEEPVDLSGIYEHDYQVYTEVLYSLLKDLAGKE